MVAAGARALVDSDAVEDLEKIVAPLGLEEAQEARVREIWEQAPENPDALEQVLALANVTPLLYFALESSGASARGEWAVAAMQRQLDGAGPGHGGTEGFSACLLMRHTRT